MHRVLREGVENRSAGVSVRHVGPYFPTGLVPAESRRYTFSHVPGLCAQKETQKNPCQLPKDFRLSSTDRFALGAISVEVRVKFLGATVRRAHH